MLCEVDMVMKDMVICVGRGLVLRMGEWEFVVVVFDGIVGEVADQFAIQNPILVGFHWGRYYF